MSAEVKLIAVLLSVLALGAAFFGYGHYRDAEGVRVTTSTFEASISRQKAEAATTLASETDKALQAERALSHLKNLQELQDADHQKTVAGLSARLRDLAGSAGRLRDPNAAGCRPGGSGSPYQLAAAPCAGSDNAAEAGGLLSGRLTELLQRLTSEADDINDAYASCRADAFTVRLN
jgi:hypothetical protein